MRVPFGYAKQCNNSRNLSIKFSFIQQKKNVTEKILYDMILQIY